MLLTHRPYGKSWFVEAFLQRSWLEFGFTGLLHDQCENEVFPQPL